MTVTTMPAARSTPTTTFLSPAKVNLILQVLHKRDDGFHEIRSLVQGVGLSDVVRIQLDPGGAVTLTCDDPGLPRDNRNLVIQACEALTEHVHTQRGATIHLTKRIPIASGLGGGSGNAAVTLLALNKLWNLGLSSQELASVGARIGSDVPLFLAMPSANVSGRGELVESVNMRWSGWVVLVFAGCEVSTPDVYSAWSSSDRSADDSSRIGAMIDAASAREVADLCINELEPAVFRVAPKVLALRDAVLGYSHRPVHVSGAGQTVFALFDDQDEAEKLRNRLVSSRIGVRSCVVATLSAPISELTSEVTGHGNL
jgi:4-diphosphocytidyl-2-C-methyl-D-erythritol kinase